MRRSSAEAAMTLEAKKRLLWPIPAIEAATFIQLWPGVPSGHVAVLNSIVGAIQLTSLTSRARLENFMKWLRVNGAELREYTPDQLVAHQREAVKAREYDILDLLELYIGSFNARRGHKVKAYSSIRSFFSHNRAELPRDTGFTIRGDEEKVRGTLTIERARMGRRRWI